MSHPSQESVMNENLWSSYYPFTNNPVDIILWFIIYSCTYVHVRKYGNIVTNTSVTNLTTSKHWAYSTHMTHKNKFKFGKMLKLLTQACTNNACKLNKAHAINSGILNHTHYRTHLDIFLFSSLPEPDLTRLWAGEESSCLWLQVSLLLDFTPSSSSVLSCTFLMTSGGVWSSRPFSSEVHFLLRSESFILISSTLVTFFTCIDEAFWKASIQFLTRALLLTGVSTTYIICDEMYHIQYYTLCLSFMQGSKQADISYHHQSVGHVKAGMLVACLIHNP